MASPQFRIRLAQRSDIGPIAELMRAAIAENMRPFLSAEEIDAARETMGLDSSLIEDQTYFVVECDANGSSGLVGCGGWGRRRTLYGGDQTAGRDDSFSDPATEPARIRAMYTHPAWTRRGIGTLLLDAGEEAARRAGFKTIELGSTIAGEPLYLARGYVEISRTTADAANGAGKTVIHMRKTL